MKKNIHINLIKNQIIFTNGASINLKTIINTTKFQLEHDIYNHTTWKQKSDIEVSKYSEQLTNFQKRFNKSLIK